MYGFIFKKASTIVLFCFAIINKIHIYNMKRDPICCLFATKSFLLRGRRFLIILFNNMFHMISLKILI
jgi:hypothetical protein